MKKTKNFNQSWDLSELYSGVNDPKIFKDLAALEKRAENFEKEHKGKVAAYGLPRTLAAVKEFGKIQEKLRLPVAFAELSFAVDGANVQINSLNQKVQVQCSEIRNHIIFFPLELGKNKNLAEFAKSKKARPFNILFKDLLENRKYQLSFAEEKIINIKATTSSAGWIRLHEKLESSLRIKLKNSFGEIKELTLEEALNFSHSPKRQERIAAAQGISNALKGNLEVSSHIYNMILLNKAREDKLRNWPYPESQRHAANSLSKKSVDALAAATREHFGLVPRYYKLKRKLLKLDRLFDYDRYAPLPQKSESKYTFEQAVKVVRAAFHAFDPEFEKYYLDILAAGHVDVVPRKGKRAGAFCAHMPHPHLPYVLLNHAGSGRDVETLAHEMGHAVHDCFAEKNPFLVAHPPLALAETASVFGEMLVFEYLLASAKTKAEQIALIAAKIDIIFATIPRQISMFFFERKVHDFVRQNGEIPAEKINEFWMQIQREMFGDSVTITENYSVWWSYIIHFFEVPFYTYAYAFGNLLVFSLYEQYKEGAPGFVENYKTLLSLGGAKTPAQALQTFGFDIERKEFWQSGFKVLEKLIEQLESLCYH